MRFAAMSLTLAAAVVAGTLYTSSLFRGESPVEGRPGPVVHYKSHTPTIEQVQKLASLVTLRVPISDVQISELQGWTGGLKLVLAVHGEVEIATDLSAAQFEALDQQQQTAILILPKPAPVRPRLDHEKTRIIELQRSGLWWVVNGQAGEETLTNQAMNHAQQLLGEIAAQQDLVEQACRHTEAVITGFFNAMGWTVTVQWA